MQKFVTWFKKPIKETVYLYLELLKVMVPIIILVKIATEFGMIELLSQVFTPLMDLVGLPAQAGIVWTTAMLINIYGGLVTLIALFPQMEMSIAQLSILGAMILVAHSLPMEQRICQMAGASLILTTLLRIVGAVVYGMILNALYGGFELLQDPASLHWLPTMDADQTLLAWVFSSLQSLFSIFWIIFALILILKIFEELKITDAISRTIAPVLKGLGMSEKAVPVTMIGVMLGLSYGGALILREARKGNMSPRDIFLSLCFMCLFHSFIEDTLLIYALGTDIFAILVGRFLFAFAVIFIIAKIVHALPDAVFERYVYRLPQKKSEKQDITLT